MLHAEHRGAFIPPLPQKTLIENSSEEFLKLRRADLQVTTTGDRAERDLTAMNTAVHGGGRQCGQTAMKGFGVCGDKLTCCTVTRVLGTRGGGAGREVVRVCRPEMQVLTEGLTALPLLLFKLRPRCHRCAFQCYISFLAVPLALPDCPKCSSSPQAYLRSIASHPLLQRSETLKVFLLQPGDLSRNPAWLMLSAAHAPKRFGEASSTLPMPTSLLAGRC